MKRLFTLVLFAGLLIGFSNTAKAQEDYSALNVFVSFGDDSKINAQYEIPIIENVTISPSVVIPFNFDYVALGVKADYYFDHLMGLSKDWDIWAGIDTGFNIGEDKNNNHDVFNINVHVGVEYKISEAFGILAEFGGGTASFGGIGVGFHF